MDTDKMDVDSLTQLARAATKNADKQESKAAEPGVRPADEWSKIRPTIVTKPTPKLDTRDTNGSLQNGEASVRKPLGTSDGPPPLREESSHGSRPTSRQQAHLSPSADDSIATSPNLRQFAIPASEGSPMETLPAMQTSPALSSKSPNGQQSLPSLPSLHLQLGNLADAHPPGKGMPLSGRQYTPNGTLHSPPQNFNSVRGPYPPLHARPSGPYPSSYPATEPSPASTHSGVSPRDPFPPSQNPRSMSPPTKFGPRQYHTTSTALTPQSEVQTPISAGTQPSARTLSTEPSPNGDRLHVDGEQMLNANGPLISGGFKCEHPGCAALPFQTQYLLNSHANVHSQNRPHYCPVKSCSRSEGGKGFKRKNEMIRHGLVHKSPGYICPFCPEREHKYPRPDNLQRHVRVHHVDKDKDDSQLREVLSQRPEGGSRGRRRRVNS